MASSEIVSKRLLSGQVQLHPQSCGSSVRWSVYAKLTRHPRRGKPASLHRDFDATVHLTDCSRQITWSGTSYEGGSETMLEKLDKAIAELQKCRRAVVRVQAYYDNLPVTKSEDE